MADERDNLVLEHLRAIRSEFGEFREDMKDVKGRLTSLEISAASLRGEVANLLAILPVNWAALTGSRTGSNGSSAV